MYKSKLQELCHKKEWEFPVYATEKDGPDHCPNFTTTVTLQGQTFQSPPNVCRSSKEAQNLAARIAYDHFCSAYTQSVPAVINPPPPVALPSPGFLDRKLQEKQRQNSQTSLADQTVIRHMDEDMPKDLHLYKNRLQHYVQKKNLSLPEYSCEIDGPPHARLFRASVKIGGITYASPAYFATLKDSEHAAAKVAFESLSVGEVQEDEGLYKTLLQEFAQKKGFQYPSYSTVAVGPPHMPTFVSTVEIGGKSFEGQECKSKKLSEMNAAKNAYNSLMECKTETFNFLHRAIKRNKTSDSEANAILSGEIHSNCNVLSPGHLMNNAMHSPSNLEQNILPKSPSVNDNDGKGKELPIQGLEESASAEKPAGVSRSRGPKIIVHPRNSAIKVPEGATVKPYSDENWVAVIKDSEE